MLLEFWFDKAHISNAYNMATKVCECYGVTNKRMWVLLKRECDGNMQLDTCLLNGVRVPDIQRKPQ